MKENQGNGEAPVGEVSEREGETAEQTLLSVSSPGLWRVVKTALGGRQVLYNLFKVRKLRHRD